jgi:hypothetical protein
MIIQPFHNAIPAKPCNRPKKTISIATLLCQTNGIHISFSPPATCMSIRKKINIPPQICRGKPKTIGIDITYTSTINLTPFLNFL